MSRHHRRHKKKEPEFEFKLQRETSNEQELENDLDKLDEMTKPENPDDSQQVGESFKLGRSRHHKHHHKKRKKKKSKKAIAKRVLIITLCVLLAILVALGAIFATLYYSGKSSLFPDRKVSITIPRENDTIVEEDGRTITHMGQKYIFNENITSILFMGVDVDALPTEGEVAGAAAKADAVYLMTFDKQTQQVNILAISRDAMVDIDTYSAGGKFVGTKNKQLCLAYSYGDGGHKSCEYTIKAVKRLLYNVPIDTYFSLELDAIPLLNDTLGGIVVPEYDDLGNPTGNKIRLMGENAINYLRYRNIQYLDSNDSRMKKQKAYIEEYLRKAVAETKNDLAVPVSLFNIVSDKSYSNLDASKITYLATTALANRSTLKYNFKKIEGEIVEGKNGLAEYHINQDALFETVLDVFYTKVK